MRSFLCSALSVLAVAGTILAQQVQKKSAPPQQPAGQSMQLRDFADSLSYALGMNIVEMVKEQNLPIRREVLLRALTDGFDAKPFAITQQDMVAVFQQYQQQKQQEEQARQAAEAAKNRAEGERFLRENAKRPGVKTTASGLQYEVLQQGTGPKPSGPAATVKVHYRGTLLDGTEFDSSYKRGEPAEFQLDRVIKGWSEAVQLMNVGSKYKFYIPADLAYGDRGAGSVIPPGALLIFEVELLETN
ncbi:MAG: FKBP-type peptidyl-prolyl cis-trans isomerase [Bacteroidota bacterium]|nr:FKBP-type peptidyl-prolyl cis-trans isomerase [Candidatus Kapabacteria bacterium]MCS7303403.1 FKBP-type peptidyl-prolyl cis-trans isomerase [Candidatus Kapabacteria bacterium]MDW8272282.1 FKBP-type peptidyl-prolyl cis-trans isomerase [Bacteroidota bacterium]